MRKMFHRFSITATVSSEDESELVGVGVVMPSGVCFVEWFNQEILSSDVGEAEAYPHGIAEVVELIEDEGFVDLVWVDNPDGKVFDETVTTAEDVWKGVPEL